ncbi:hypothetical protein W02_17210 [Nitrospira sp. KM1]|uniref:hypothetical protein n=1 Tax=Nitrospira sp. KM1 TaxID=1936990 RepID=UPI0013A79132|nr:hypothetical protein [Nitrospira sp. KM1]BCA54581.1 hypothetical protein W02_17210 [Nitrospira sp. KM1]
MSYQTAANQILEVVIANPDCTLDELSERLPDMHWSDVFLEVDRLSRKGQLLLIRTSSGFTTTLRAQEP